jgi:hypothetical protein
MKLLFIMFIVLCMPFVGQAQDPQLSRMKADTDQNYYLAGHTFTVMVKINSGTSYVYSSSSILTYPTQYLDVVSVAPGDHLGETILFTYQTEEANGKVHMSISQTGSQSGVSGIGTVYLVTFSVSTNPNLNVVSATFGNSEIDVRDPNANLLSISNTNHIVTLCEAVVWPGDLNNNGIVNEADILQIGLHFNETGPSRTNATFQWRAEPASMWNDIQSVYVDATGDGHIKINDMPAVGFNYGKTHTVLNKPLVLGKMQGGNYLYAELQQLTDTTAVLLLMAQAENLFGIAFKMHYQLSEVEVQSVTLGDYFPNAGVFFHYDNPNEGYLAIGVSLLQGEPGVTATSSLVLVEVQVTGQVSNIDFTDIVAVDPAGNALIFIPGILGTDDLPQTVTTYSLQQNYPNPFNPSTTIKYSLPTAERVSLKIYNILGQEVVTLVDELQDAGYKQTTWDAKDLYGNQVVSGIYIYRLQSDNFVQSKKMILLK